MDFFHIDIWQLSKFLIRSQYLHIFILTLQILWVWTKSLPPFSCHIFYNGRQVKIYYTLNLTTHRRFHSLSLSFHSLLLIFSFFYFLAAALQYRQHHQFWQQWVKKNWFYSGSINNSINLRFLLREINQEKREERYNDDFTSF